VQPFTTQSRGETVLLGLASQESIVVLQLQPEVTLLKKLVFARDQLSTPISLS